MPISVQCACVRFLWVAHSILSVTFILASLLLSHIFSELWVSHMLAQLNVFDFIIVRDSNNVWQTANKLLSFLDEIKLTWFFYQDVVIFLSDFRSQSESNNRNDISLLFAGVVFVASQQRWNQTVRPQKKFTLSDYYFIVYHLKIICFFYVNWGTTTNFSLVKFKVLQLEKTSSKTYADKQANAPSIGKEFVSDIDSPKKIGNKSKFHFGLIKYLHFFRICWWWWWRYNRNKRNQTVWQSM